MKITRHALLEFLAPAAALPLLSALIFGGVGDIFMTSLLGLFLCLIGFLQKSAQIDLKIFIPYLVYCLISMLSAFNVYGTIGSGSYVPRQPLFLVLYLLMASFQPKQRALLKQMCVLFAVAVAALSLGQFMIDAVLYGRAQRLGGLLENPNALGIFLVVSWFALMHCTADQKEDGIFLIPFLPNLEPILLVALALTLSMGSFVSMAVGILVLLVEKKRRTSSWETFRSACRILARLSLGIGSGILIYLTATRTGLPWFCLILLLYAGILVVFWKKLTLFFEECPQAALVVSFGGFFVAAIIILSRPSSVETFVERLEMMRNGIRYLLQYPILGVGPGQWRILNLFSGEKYFNTWYIHNSYIHVGAELGMAAMGLLILITIQVLKKRLRPWAKAGSVAFFVHNLMDTCFFHTGVMTLVGTTLAEPQIGGKRLTNRTVKLLFGAFALLFLCSLFFCVGNR